MPGNDEGQEDEEEVVELSADASRPTRVVMLVTKAIGDDGDKALAREFSLTNIFSIQGGNRTCVVLSVISDLKMHRRL